MGLLSHNLDWILQESLSRNTRNTYKSALQSYLKFCSQMAFIPLPSNEHILMLYVASSFQRLGFKTLKVYLAGIQYSSIMQGYPLSVADMHRLHYALRGIRRIQGNSFVRPIRQPILLSHIDQLRWFYNTHFPSPDNYMLIAASLLAYYGLLQ